MKETREGAIAPQEHNEKGLIRDPEGKVYRTVPLSAEEIQQYNEERWGPKENLVKVEVSSDDGKSWGTIVGRVSPEEAQDIIDRNVKVVEGWVAGREDAEKNRKELEDQGFDLTGYMTEIEEHRDSGSSTVRYWGGAYWPDAERLKIGYHPWVANNGVHESAFASPDEAKKWIKDRWDYAHKK